MEPNDCFEWEQCGRSGDGNLMTYRAKLPDDGGWLYLTVARTVFGVIGVSQSWVPDEVYVVDDTDRSKTP